MQSAITAKTITNQQNVVAMRCSDGQTNSMDSSVHTWLFIALIFLDLMCDTHFW